MGWCIWLSGRWKVDAKGAKIHHPVSKRPILQFVSIKRKDCGEWAIPGVCGFYISFSSFIDEVHCFPVCVSVTLSHSNLLFIVPNWDWAVWDFYGRPRYKYKAARKSRHRIFWLILHRYIGWMSLWNTFDKDMYWRQDIVHLNKLYFKHQCTEQLTLISLQITDKLRNDTILNH